MANDKVTPLRKPVKTKCEEITLTIFSTKFFRTNAYVIVMNLGIYPAIHTWVAVH
jgi:hypothetical protein